MESSKQYIPELRFPEFSGDWVKKTLGDFTERITRKVGNAKLLAVSISAGVGFVDQKNKFGRDISGEQYKNYIKLKEGEFAYNKGNSLKYPQGCVYMLKEYATVACPNVFICFAVTDEQIFAEFILRYFEMNYHGIQLQKYITSGVRGNGLLNVSANDFFNISFFIPNLPEQRKIAACLSSLDSLIKSVGKKIDLLRQHKKGLMQKLFPRLPQGRDAINRVSTNQNVVPELRFPNFSGDWEVKRLGECFEMLQNNTLSRAELNDKCGDYQNVHYGDVLIKYGSILDLSKERLPYINNKNVAEKYEKSLLKDGDVIIADTAEDETVGKCTEIINVGEKKIISGLHTIPIRPTIDFAKCFIGLYFNSNVWHSQLLRIMQGTKVFSISKSQLKNISVCFPSLAEQRKIADCLSSIDKAIEETENKVRLLEQHKKGLMQKMFVKM
ncbi:MAG: restriction endonuclease subunit S [Bacteroidales bacterium]|nr:restriction endonuclease subunit S [Bacteroidales bacterium]